MINGAHAIIYSTDADADRAFLKDLLATPSADAGGGWLILGLPPAEIAVHPAEAGGRQELYLMCADVNALVASLAARGVPCAPVSDQRWELLTEVTLPSGAKLGVYEPRHARPAAAEAPRAARTVRKEKAAKRKPPAAKKKAGKKKAGKKRR